MALYERCGDEIALANDLDRAGDIDVVMVAGTPRRLSARHWQIFTLLYDHRGDVVYPNRIHAQLYRGARERPVAHNLIREHVRALRRVLGGSRYLIENYRGIAYELIVADAAGTAPTTPFPRNTHG
jgi:DNA-binding response OmpR family regulator